MAKNVIMLLMPEEEQKTAKKKFGLSLGKKVQSGVSQVIDQVEQPSGQAARETFGYRMTDEEKRRAKTKRTVIEIVSWLGALGLVVGILAWNWEKIRNFFDFVVEPEPEVVVEAPVVIESQVVESVLAGMTIQIEQDLGWVREELFDDLVYYQAGELVGGDYVGAKRYIATGILRENGTLRVYEFWEMKDGRVLLNGGKPNPILWLQTMEDFYLGMYFDDKVQLVDSLMGDFPQTLPLNSEMMLYRREMLTQLGPYDGAVVGMPRLELTLSPDYYEQLPALDARNYPELKFYSKMYNSDELFSQIADNIHPSDDAIVDEYLYGGTKVVVTDRTGLSMVYELVFNYQWENYRRNSLNRDLQNLEFYQQELIKYTATAAYQEYKRQVLVGVEEPEIPTGRPTLPKLEVGIPGFSFEVQAFEFDEAMPGFARYISAYTAPCVARIDAKVLQNVTMSDLRQVGRIFIPQTSLYVLADDYHPLNHLAYNLKFVQETIPEEEFLERNREVLVAIGDYNRSQANLILSGRRQPELPTFEQYVNKMPLLVMTDPWGRLLLVWENDVEFLQECGTI